MKQSRLLHYFSDKYLTKNNILFKIFFRTKWTEEELEQLRSAITMFGDDMSKVASKIKTRSL